MCGRGCGGATLAGCVSIAPVQPVGHACNQSLANFFIAISHFAFGLGALNRAFERNIYLGGNYLGQVEGRRCDY
jgi:hypothetical protein